jgi:hypothetical protein
LEELRQLLFPEPLRPTMPTVVPGAMAHEKLRRISGPSNANILQANRALDGRQAHLARPYVVP